MINVDPVGDVAEYADLPSPDLVLMTHEHGEHDTLKMRALRTIDITFVCMHVPFTRDAVAAQDAVGAFATRYVYPHHYRSRGTGTQDPNGFSEMSANASEVEVRFGDRYG